MSSSGSKSGGGAVSSVFGRIGAVVAQAGDYTAGMVGADVAGAAAAVSAALTALAATLGSLATESPTGTADTNHYLSGAFTWLPIAWKQSFPSIGAATIDTSGLSDPTPYPMANWQLDMSVPVGDGPVGSALTVQVYYTTDEGNTKTALGSALSIAAGSTTPATETVGPLGTPVPTGARLFIQCTSNGSTTAATKVNIVTAGTP